jgi:hypothetical protein
MKQKKQPKYLGDIVIVIVKVELQSGAIVLPQDHRQHHMQPIALKVREMPTSREVRLSNNI